MKKELTAAVSFDEGMAQMYRTTPALAVKVLNECLEEGDADMLLLTLRQLTKAFGGIAQIAASTGLNENTLYRTLSRQGNPNLKTLMRIADAMDMRLTFTPKAGLPARAYVEG